VSTVYQTGDRISFQYGESTIFGHVTRIRDDGTICVSLPTAEFIGPLSMVDLPRLSRLGGLNCYDLDLIK